MKIDEKDIERQWTLWDCYVKEEYNVRKFRIAYNAR